MLLELLLDEEWLLEELLEELEVGLLLEDDALELELWLELLGFWLELLEALEDDRLLEDEALELDALDEDWLLAEDTLELLVDEEFAIFEEEATLDELLSELELDAWELLAELDELIVELLLDLLPAFEEELAKLELDLFSDELVFEEVVALSLELANEEDLLSEVDCCSLELTSEEEISSLDESVSLVVSSWLLNWGFELYLTLLEHAEIANAPKIDNKLNNFSFFITMIINHFSNNNTQKRNRILGTIL